MGNDTKRRLAVAAAFLVAATAGSRVLGLVREIVMVSYLGLGDPMGAFTVANKVPSLIRTLLADTALSAAFIPVFSGLLEKQRQREAWQVAYTVTVLATAVLGVVTILGMLFAPAVVRLVAPGFSDNPQVVALTVHLMRVMFPTVVILGIAGILMGILNSYNHFALPASAPIVWNLVIIGVVMAFSAGYGVKALAWGMLVGTGVELLLQVPSVWRRRWRTRSAGGGADGETPSDRRGVSPYRLVLHSPELRRVGLLLGPVILSLGIINFNAFIGTIVATLISVPAPAIIERAFRLFQLPQGVFAIAIGTVLFPAFSRHAASNRMVEFREDLSTGLRQIFFVTLPFAAFFAVLAVPTVRLIYEHGKVTAGDTELVASALTFFSVGMAFVSMNTLLNRAFYSIQKAWAPLITGVMNLALNTLLMLLLYKPLGVGGITLSTSLVSFFNFFGLMVLLSPRIGGVDARRVAWSGARAIVALIPLSAVAYGVWWGLDAILGRRVWAQVVSVGLAYVIGGVAYCLAAWAMRVPELREVVNVLRRRREPRSTEEVIDLESRD
ncbi:MAG TPA: murein biosynthesis integral membrane protein MurJ [Thermoleophilia bacterium]|nr:murein biosynthesis integral membrane protein MurJ [Thermoleophilia bacterium]